MCLIIISQIKWCYNHKLCTYFYFKINNITFDIEPAIPIAQTDGAKSIIRCPVQLQKETPTGLADTVCNGDVADKHAGLCR